MKVLTLLSSVCGYYARSTFIITISLIIINLLINGDDIFVNGLSSSPLTSPGAGSSHQELLSSSLPSPSPVLDETIDSTILESSINRRHIRDETRIDSNLNQALYNRQQINQSKVIITIEFK